MIKAEPAALIGILAATIISAAHWWLGTDVEEAAAEALAALVLALLIRANVVSPRTHERLAAAARRGAGADRTTGAAVLVLVAANLAAACMPAANPFDEQLREAREAGREIGAAAAHRAASECLTDAALASDHDVLLCIFGSEAVAAAPDRSPSRADRLRDQATDAVEGILGALGRRGASEIEGR